MKGNVVLIGDAAHAMTPDLGQGACNRLIDAVTLARRLSEPTTETALHEYDRQRRRASQRVANASNLMNGLTPLRRFPTPRTNIMRLALQLPGSRF